MVSCLPLPFKRCSLPFTQVYNAHNIKEKFEEATAHWNEHERPQGEAEVTMVCLADRCYKGSQFLCRPIKVSEHGHYYLNGFDAEDIRAYNKSISEARVLVEHIFADLSSFWPSTTVPTKHKLSVSRSMTFIFCAMFMHNARLAMSGGRYCDCYSGSGLDKYFDLLEA